MMFHTPRYSEWFDEFDFEKEEQKRVMSLEERADRERANLLRNFCVRDCGSGAAETWIPGEDKGKKGRLGCRPSQNITTGYLKWNLG